MNYLRNRKGGRAGVKVKACVRTGVHTRGLVVNWWMNENTTATADFNPLHESGPRSASQRSLQDAPIFRLLLKVAVKGTHQCDFFNFWGSLGLPTIRSEDRTRESSFQGFHGILHRRYVHTRISCCDVVCCHTLAALRTPSRHDNQDGVSVAG